MVELIYSKCLYSDVLRKSIGTEIEKGGPGSGPHPRDGSRDQGKVDYHNAEANKHQDLADKAGSSKERRHHQEIADLHTFASMAAGRGHNSEVADHEEYIAERKARFGKAEESGGIQKGGPGSGPHPHGNPHSTLAEHHARAARHHLESATEAKRNGDSKLEMRHQQARRWHNEAASDHRYASEKIGTSSEERASATAHRVSELANNTSRRLGYSEVPSTVQKVVNPLTRSEPSPEDLSKVVPNPLQKGGPGSGPHPHTGRMYEGTGSYQEARKLESIHREKADYHDDEASRGSSNEEKVAAHTKAMTLHEHAADKFAEAKAHFDKGGAEATEHGKQAFQEASKLGRSANARSEETYARHS